MTDNSNTEMLDQPVGQTNGGARLAVTEGITAEHLAEIYADPYMQRIGWDCRPAAPVIHPSAQYVSAWVGDAFAGAFLVIRSSVIESDFHSLLKRSSVKHSRSLLRLAIDWAFNQRPILRLTAYIAEGLESARNAAIKVGFVPEGRMRHACIKNGRPCDVHMLSIIREDWRRTRGIYN